ncbi:hypothetical protein B0T20DRAFT_217967 [Sordaria brevicollis]|uniref:Uncharacterized protein n=1 Tax=Sordaria brevicollis TaxID=83679 RepID=A0AAE0PF19_SORBR|nr:hypothetical protein B0T20DRAFT_217967 [Sordaria brevicollis]
MSKDCISRKNSDLFLLVSKVKVGKTVIIEKSGRGVSPGENRQEVRTFFGSCPGVRDSLNFLLGLTTRWGHVFSFLSPVTSTLNKMRKSDPSHAISNSSAVSHEIRFLCFETDSSFLFLIASVSPPPHSRIHPLLHLLLLASFSLHCTNKQPPTTPTRGYNCLSVSVPFESLGPLFNLFHDMILSFSSKQFASFFSSLSHYQIVFPSDPT